MTQDTKNELTANDVLELIAFAYQSALDEGLPHPGGIHPWCNRIRSIDTHLTFLAVRPAFEVEVNGDTYRIEVRKTKKPTTNRQKGAA